MPTREPRRDESEPHRKLRTSREVYDQIRWDPRLDAAAFVLGYETRGAGIQEVNLLSFDPQGEIPWHRIQHIRRGSTTVWDRRERLDLLDSPRRAPPASAPSGLDARPPRADEAEAHMAEWHSILPIAFPVRSIQLISRRDDEPFEVRSEIPLTPP